MPIRKRSLSRSALDDNARLWLDGDERCSIVFRGKHPDEPAKLWDEYGDQEMMGWDPAHRFRLPVRK